MKQNKDVRLTMRLTPEQYESICQRAETAQMTPSAYARAAAMRHKVTVVPGLKELTHELKAIGRNINQLTVLAHEGRVQVARLDETYEKLGLVFLALRDLAEQENQKWRRSTSSKTPHSPPPQ